MSLSRREFLQISFTVGGGLLITACKAQIPTPSPTAPAVPTPTPIPAVTPMPGPPFVPSLFISIESDGRVTLTIHRSEMGQGVRTALAMILAEELEADWTMVHVEQMPATTSDEVGSQLTGGSTSIAGHYDWLRRVGSRVRQMLQAAAAQIWGVEPGECQANAGAVIHPSTQRRLSYGELISVARTLDASGFPTQFKEPKDFRLIGTSVTRVDEADILTGKAQYGLDVRLPNMLFAMVARCPVVGGGVETYDDSAAKRVPGVQQVVRVPSGVAVLATNTWAAQQGRAALTIQWREGNNAQTTSATVYEQLANRIERLKARETTTLTTLDAEYTTPYIAHATLEPMNCTADVRADGCEIWAPTQNPQEVQSFVQARIRQPTVVHVTLLGGGFGRRLEVDYAIEAAAVSKAAGVPVQVVWTRDDDLQHDFYRSPTHHWLRAGWDAEQKLMLWRHYIAGPGHEGVAFKVGQELLGEGLEAPYEVADRRSESVLGFTPYPTGPWRAVMAGPNAFANECFMDEIASALQQDPYQLRMDLLPTMDMLPASRLRGALELAAARSDWGTALPQGHGRGIACHSYHNTAVAMVAEVTVANGRVQVERVVCALDCGSVVHPDIVAQQMEGGVLWGLDSLLKSEIVFKQGRVQHNNFDDYPVLRMNEMPRVEVYPVPSTHPPSGVGEMGVPPIVPAVVNAIYAATGIRIRRLPLRPDDLK